MATHPRDRFDDLPHDLVRVGAHRAAPKRGRGWIAFAWAALATGLLVVGGLFVVAQLDDFELDLPILSDSPTATDTAVPEPTSTVVPVTDPTTIDPARDITITVLNGTPVIGEQDAAGDSLAALGWPVDSRANASTTDVATTTVYYGDAANEDVARGLLVALGVGTVLESDSFLGADVTVVLGADYEPLP
jgi:hypothetical protein